MFVRVKETLNLSQNWVKKNGKAVAFVLLAVSVGAKALGLHHPVLDWAIEVLPLLL